MKRTKNLLSVIVALLLAFAMSFAVACGNGGNDNGNGNDGDNFGITDSSVTEPLALQRIILGGTYNREFTLGAPFSYAGLLVTAEYIDTSISNSTLTTEVLAEGQYQVDYSEYNPYAVGTYVIYVSYTHANVTRTASYTVELLESTPAFGGIVAKLAEGQTGEFALTADNPSVTVSKDIIEVYEVNADGEVASTPLNPAAYDAELYLGSTKIENNVATENGVYALVATLVADSSKHDFVSINVVNPVTGIVLDETAGGVFEQAAGMVDRMSETWQFTVTYANGATKTVKAGDAGLTIELDTRSTGAKTATVTYTEGNHSANCTVSYTITGGGDVQPADPLVINISELVAAGTLGIATYNSEVALGADDNASVSVLANASNTVDVDSNSKSMDGYSFTHRLKLGGKGTNEARSIKIEVSCAVTVTVYMMSSSSSATRQVGIWTGEFDPNPTEGTATEPVAAMQEVGGSSLEKHEYAIEAAGTYYLAAVSGGTNVYGIVITPEGGSVQPSQPAGEQFMVNISELVEAGTLGITTYNSEVALGANDYSLISVLANASNTVDVDSNGKSMDGYSFTHRLKLGGKGTHEARSIKIEVSCAVTVTVYMMSSSSSATRQVGIWTGEFDPNPTEGTATEPVAAMQEVGGASLEKHEYVLDAAGIYYLAAVSGGTNVYGIIITPNV